MGSQAASLLRKTPARALRASSEPFSALERLHPVAQESRTPAPAIDAFRKTSFKSLTGIPVFPPEEGNPGGSRIYPGSRLPIQFKLAIGAANDPLEAEADAMAAGVMGIAPHVPASTGTAAPALRRKCSCGGEKCDKCKQEQEIQVQRKATASVTPREAPPIVHETLRSPGQPLDSSTRSFFEPRFKRDFSSVRVHADDKAAESASAVHAFAFTVGQNIVFASGKYAPQTSAGQQLLAHELSHTIQQGFAASVSMTQPDARRFPSPASRSAVRVMRQQAAGQGSPELAAAAAAVATKTRVRQWLELHQFAPPEKQPEGEKEERHVLLNGEEMTVSDAVKLAAAALPAPPELVKSVITAALAEPIATTAAGLPFIGHGNEVPGINLAGPRDAFGVSPAIARTVEFSSIDEYLTAHGFAAPEIRDPTGDRVLLDGKETTVEEVANRAFALLGQYPSLKKADVVAYIRQKYVAARGGAGNQIVLGYTLVPQPTQLVGGRPDPLNPLRTQHQFSFTITRQHHANDSPGFETSFQGSVTLTDQGILNVQAGGQEAIVKPLLHGWIQVSGLLQLMASENWSKSAAGTTVISPAVQATGGGQVLLTPTFRAGDYKFLNGHVQFGVQVLGGVQVSPSGTVGILNAGIVLNIPFSL